ncbi:antibiotic biosynthesis monooxygenase [Dokdonella sp.]|uniref:antibiotic biosynthesis monooxygenase n=1 Tax=Dokdonella sp. TaxID=2291710 RepID=UPI0035289F6D
MSTPPLPRPEELATLVIQHWVAHGRTEEYERWLGRIMPVSQSFPGHLGANVIRPADLDQPYTIVLRFDTIEHLEDWARSDRRKRLVAEIADLLVAPDTLDVHIGAAFWFTPVAAGSKAPVRWKQALLTLMVIYPLTVIVPALLGFVLAAIPWLGGRHVDGFIAVALIVILVVYQIMPRLTRLLAGWLTR